MADTPATFTLAYVRFMPPIRAKCRRLLGTSADVEEIVQDTFLRLWQGGPPLPPAGDPRTVMAWLYRTCTHLAIDALRRRLRRPLAEPESLDALPCALSIEQLSHARQLIAALHARVPEDELHAVVLCRVDGLPHAEAAEVLEISERTLRRLVARFDERSAEWRKETAS